ncbi:MAG TPA: helix-turn-helix domain-containing protein [Blastocatellia bacterium]|nr:helix-turn-helix domain-containing protein [Blastocatellia bacterium]
MTDEKPDKKKPKPRRGKSPLADRATAELIGKIAILEGVVAQLIERLEQQDFRCKQIEDRLARVVSPSQLITEARAAEMLNLSTDTLWRWRNEKTPRIPFLRTGRRIKYRVTEIESYLNGREHGAKKGRAK